jgi:hypothetical protein
VSESFASLFFAWGPEFALVTEPKCGVGTFAGVRVVVMGLSLECARGSGAGFGPGRGCECGVPLS